MQLATPRRSAATLLLLTAMTALCLVPQRASADAPFVATHPTMPPVPAPASTAFVSAELVDTLSNVINNGIRLGPGLGKGTFYVQVESQGFGGVLSVRYRR